MWNSEHKNMGDGYEAADLLKIRLFLLFWSGQTGEKQTKISYRWGIVYGFSSMTSSIDMAARIKCVCGGHT